MLFIELATMGKADVLNAGDADLLVMNESCMFSIHKSNMLDRMVAGRGCL